MLNVGLSDCIKKQSLSSRQFVKKRTKPKHTRSLYRKRLLILIFHWYRRRNPSIGVCLSIASPSNINLKFSKKGIILFLPFAHRERERQSGRDISAYFKATMTGDFITKNSYIYLLLFTLMANLIDTALLHVLSGKFAQIIHSIRLVNIWFNELDTKNHHFIPLSASNHSFGQHGVDCCRCVVAVQTTR